MAILFTESFETDPTWASVVAKWSAGTTGGATPAFSTNYGRRDTYGMFMTDVGSNSSRLYSQVGKEVNTAIFGIAWKSGASSSSSSAGAHLSYQYAAQLGFRINTSRQIAITRGGESGTTIATSTEQIPNGKWCYIELKATIHSITGSYELRLNGTTILSATDVNTQATGTALLDGMCILNRYNTIYVDDIYLLDTTGAVCNDFLGDVRVDSLVPDGAGANTSWSPSTGANWECVNDAPPNGDTDYVYTSISGVYDIYSFQDLTTISGEVFGIMAYVYGRKVDAGTKYLRIASRPASTNYDGDRLFTLSDSYAYYLEALTENPETAAQWTISEVNSAEFGIKSEA